MVIHGGLSEKLDVPTLGSLPGIAVSGNEKWRAPTQVERREEDDNINSCRSMSVTLFTEWLVTHVVDVTSRALN